MNDEIIEFTLEATQVQPFTASINSLRIETLEMTRILTKTLEVTQVQPFTMMEL